MRVGRLIVVALVALCGSGAGARAAGAMAWTGQPVPSPQVGNGRISSIACPTSTLCEAVGEATAPDGTQVALTEQWAAGSWSVQTAPVPAGGTDPALDGVACASATVCEAVGAYVTPAGAHATFAAAWNGTSWAAQAVPNPAGSSDNELLAVACPASTSCTAVGEQRGPGGGFAALADAFRSGVWTEATDPALSALGALDAISCAPAAPTGAAGPCLATDGSYTVAVQTGASWSAQAAGSAASDDSLDAVACPASDECIAVGSDIGATGARASSALVDTWNGSSWTAVNPAIPRQANTDPNLAAISCPSPTNCTATGPGPVVSDLLRYGPPFAATAFTEQWNGGAWTPGTVPRVGLLANAELLSLDCPTTSLCLSAGYMLQVGAGEDGQTPFAQQWSAGRWTSLRPVVPVGAGQGALDAVACPTATACAAVGGVLEQNGFLVPVLDYPLAEHETGSGWQVDALPGASPLSGPSLDSIACSGTAACVAVGSHQLVDPLAEQWNGRAWRLIGAGLPTVAAGDTATLAGVACPAANLCLAVGQASAPPALAPIALVWNGGTWQPLTVPVPAGSGGATLAAVSCASSTSCLAVGAYDGADGSEPLAVQWNGTSWTLDSAPTADDAAFTAVSCPASGAGCLAIGEQSSTTSIAAEWDGTSWTSIAAPPAGQNYGGLGAVSCATLADCAAVGEDPASAPVAVSWNGRSWLDDRLPAAPVVASAGALAGVACQPSGACTAVGWVQGLAANGDPLVDPGTFLPVALQLS